MGKCDIGINLAKQIFAKKVPVRRLGVFQHTRDKICHEVNSLKSDKARILKLNKITENNNPFIIIDKQKSIAEVYQNGKLHSTFPIGVGKTEGDALNSVYYDFSRKTFGSIGTTTPSGQFKLRKLPSNCTNASSYKNGDNVNAVLLDGVQHPVEYSINSSLALHQIPIEQFESRLAIFSQTGRRSMSTGCINFKPKDYEELSSLITEKTAVYILPEEVGNKLFLETNPLKKMWFRTVYRNQNQNEQLSAAIDKYFKGRR